MKNTILALSLLMAVAAQAQTDEKPVAATATVTAAAQPANVVTSDNIKPENFLPALGTFHGNGSSTGDVTITVDATNLGIVWVEGLPQGKFKALLKQSPATYKIPSQKTESGKQVAEGTLLVNPETKELTVMIGKAFDDANPASFVSNTNKGKAFVFTGTKAE